jgi:transcriptional regulator with XRE-family HTH domain
MQNSSNTGNVKPHSIGELLRGWRARRRYSQMALALDVGVSPRHLSFIETGRARPSAAMLDALTERLDVPLRERNRLLLAAGYAPRYTERLLDETGLQRVRQSLDRLLRAHEPYPGVVLDRQWNVVVANTPAIALTSLLPAFLKEPAVNIFRASLHPEGLAALTENFNDWARYLLRTLHRSVMLDGARGLAELEREVTAYPNVVSLPMQSASELAHEDAFLVPCILRLPFGRVSLFTTLTTFGTARDVTLDELCVELFYPSDEASEQLLRSVAAGGAN